MNMKFSSESFVHKESEYNMFGKSYVILNRGFMQQKRKKLEWKDLIPFNVNEPFLTPIR